MTNRNQIDIQSELHANNDLYEILKEKLIENLVKSINKFA